MTIQGVPLPGPVVGHRRASRGRASVRRATANAFTTNHGFRGSVLTVRTKQDQQEYVEDVSHKPNPVLGSQAGL